MLKTTKLLSTDRYLFQGTTGDSRQQRRVSQRQCSPIHAAPSASQASRLLIS